MRSIVITTEQTLIPPMARIILPTSSYGSVISRRAQRPKPPGDEAGRNPEPRTPNPELRTPNSELHIARARALDQAANELTGSESAVTPRDCSGGDAPTHFAPADRRKPGGSSSHSLIGLITQLPQFAPRISSDPWPPCWVRSISGVQWGHG
jgi:hypothetical protein